MLKKVLGSNVVVKAFDMEEKTASGIYVPTAKGKKQQIGTVLKVGAGYLLENGTRMPLEVEEGDKVVFEPYAGTKITVDGEELIILNENDLLVCLC